MRRLLLPALLLTLSGCSGYSLHTNLDKQNFDDYYRPSSVTVYTAEQLTDLNYKELGPVQGESCRNRSDLPPAQVSDARTQARTSVAEMGGNGVTFSQCLTLTGDDSLPGCIDSIICIGTALAVEAP
ncbi:MULTISPECIES: Rcs stress response system protein RcsF [Corallincola]|uniref:Exopolysaccharide biosynthesis protein n=2 Tax=Corallincola TaxID=1775176 RepID=A0A368NEH8_9GAMM|nr:MULTISPECIES: Rcs stress response system protein RcsF [Corallincola]RCU48888.1 exopolysaccharide biosynthesis protein [Corallincola holothuriorum]TAA43780.1 exopolysaccharide biosynthesis protein [Corallincola spongiicola]